MTAEQERLIVVREQSDLSRHLSYSSASKVSTAHRTLGSPNGGPTVTRTSGLSMVPCFSAETA